MPESQTGGGSATQGGVNYQNRIAAWVAVQILAEQDAAPPWGLPASATLDFLRCETPEPVDDILVGNSLAGHSFIQAKHSISFGTAEDSELASVIDQYVRQYHAHPAPIQTSKWDRPLDAQIDRLILVTRNSSSARVRDTLPKVLERIALLGTSQPIADAATSEDDREVLKILLDHVSRSWKAVSDNEPNELEIRRFTSLIRVQTLDVDPQQGQEREAKSLLRASVLKNPTDADLAWDRIVQACATFAANRSGATRSELQNILLTSGIDLKATRSYRSDIEKIQRLSMMSLRSLSSFSEIRVGATSVVKVQRQSTSELRKAAISGSLVVVGQPGAGKSGALHDVASVLASDGDVILLAVGQFDAGSLGSLRNEFGCTHEIVDILRNWPGIRPGFLIIDALDAARTEAGAKAFRDLIGAVITGNTRWRVIPSIRKFDLRYSVPLHALFQGAPPSTYQDHEFSALRHLEVPVLSDSELTQVRGQSPELGRIISDAGQDLLNLLRVPFNLRLMAELVGTGAAVDSLTPIRTQIQLLERYWRERVIGSDANGDSREAVLRSATGEMVSQRSLRIDRGVVASDPAASAPLHEIMSAQLLVEWQPSPESAPNRYVITFAHHILFDYAASRLLFRGPINQVVSWLGNEPDLLVAIRPSLTFHFQHLWDVDAKRQAFWDFVFAIFSSNKIPSTGKIAGPLVAAQLIKVPIDYQPLLSALRDETSAHHAAGQEAFRHMMGAIRSSANDAERPLVGQNAPPWCQLLLDIASI